LETPRSCKIESWVSIGGAIEIDQRAIYPVARFSVVIRCGGLLAFVITPLAILITEQDSAYAISLTEEEITLDQLLIRGSFAKRD